MKLPVSVRRSVCCALSIVVCGFAFGVLAPAALGAESDDPVTTVPADPGGSGSAPNPDPAPGQTPPPATHSTPPPASSSSSTYTPTYTPTLTAPAIQTGPTAAELERRRQQQLKQQKKLREAALKRKREEAERKQLQRLVIASVGNFVPIGAVALPSVDQTSALPKLEDVAPASNPGGAQPTAAAPTIAGSSSGSAMSGAAPILLGLLAVAIILLLLASLPPWTVRHAHLSAIIVHRRLEIGLIGTAVLASAAIGLVIALAAG